MTSTSEMVHGGKTVLRLAMAAENPEEPPVQVETAPMWLVARRCRSRRTRMLIHGWVDIPKRIVGSVDGY